MVDRDDGDRGIAVRNGAVCVKREGAGLVEVELVFAGVGAGVGISATKLLAPRGEGSGRLGDTLRDGRARVAVADELSDVLTFSTVVVRAKSKYIEEFSPSAPTTAETTTAGAGAAAPGSCQKLGGGNPLRVCDWPLLCTSDNLDLPWLEAIDLYDEDNLSFHEPLSPWLSFHDVDDAS